MNPAIERVLAKVDSRGVRQWGRGYLASRADRETPDPSRPLHLYVCVGDHYEPNHKRPGLDEEHRRVDAWVAKYPEIAKRHRDSSGRPHVRTFFFPIDEYRPEHLDKLAALCRDGYGDVEVHLHHDHDTADQLRGTLLGFAETLFDRHGLLRKNPTTGVIEWGFIHGNWALDNSHPEGRFCGVDDEISVLASTGCYVDMTLPSAPAPTQTHRVNSIYYARGVAGRAKNHDDGEPLVAGSGSRPHDEHTLLMVQGPLAPNIRSRKFGIVPRLESGELSPDVPVDPADRVPVWFEHAPALRGAPNHRFLKLHAHGTAPGGEEYFLAPGGGFDRLLTTLEQYAAANPQCVLHYVTAWEMVDVIKKLEAGTLAP